MKLTKAEKETTINFDEESNEAQIYTYNVKLINKINEKVETYPKLYKIVAEDGYGGITCVMPKKKLSIRLLGEVSEETSRKASERALKNKPLQKYLNSKSAV